VKLFFSWGFVIMAIESATVATFLDIYQSNHNTCVC